MNKVEKLLMCAAGQAGKIAQTAGQLGDTAEHAEGSSPCTVPLAQQCNELVGVLELLDEQGVPMSNLNDRTAIDAQKQRIRDRLEQFAELPASHAQSLKSREGRQEGIGVVAAVVLGVFLILSLIGMAVFVSALAPTEQVKELITTASKYPGALGKTKRYISENPFPTRLQLWGWELVIKNEIHKEVVRNSLNDFAESKK